MNKITYTNHIYEKCGRGWEEKRTIEGKFQIVEEDYISLTVKKGRYSYYIPKHSIIEII